MGSGNNPSTKADLFSAQRSLDTSSPSADQPKSSHPDETAVASSQSYGLPANLPSALSHLDDNQLDRLLAAVLAEQQQRGKILPISDKSHRKHLTKEAPIHLPLGKLSAVRTAFKAGVTPSRIARQFRISLSDVKLALASGPSK